LTPIAGTETDAHLGVEVPPPALAVAIVPAVAIARMRASFATSCPRWTASWKRAGLVDARVVRSRRIVN
jgi:hypothetical protein